MASFSSVQIKGTTANSSTSACGIYWEEISTDIASNTSVVKAYLCVKNKYTSDSIRDSGCSFSITVNGVKKSSGTKSVTVPANSDWYVVFESDNVTVAHNSDGSKTITISAKGSFPNTSPGSISASGEAVLTTLARASSISRFQGTILEVDGQNAINVGIDRKSEDFTHTVVYELGSLSETHTGVEDSDSFVVPRTWRTQGLLRTATSATGSVTVTTFNGDTQIGEPVSLAFTAIVPEGVRPVLTDSGITLELVQQANFNSSVYVENRSKVKATIAATSEIGVTTYIAQLNGATYSSAGNVITTREVIGGSDAGAAVTLKFRAVDPRGRYSDWVEKEITVYKYAAPSLINASVYRCTADLTADASGAYICVTAGYKISSLGGTNAVTQFAPRFKAASGSMGSWLTGLAANTPYRIGGSLLATQTYVVEIIVKDTAGNTHALSFTVPTASVTFNLRDGGKGAAFGKYAEQDNLLDSAWPVNAPSASFATPLPFSSGGTNSRTAAGALTALGAAPAVHTHAHLDNTNSAHSGYTQINFDDQANVLGMLVQGQYSATDATTVRLSLRVNKDNGQIWARVDSKAGTQYPQMYTSANPPPLSNCGGVLGLTKGGSGETTASASLTAFGIRRGRTVNIDVNANAVTTATVTFSSALSAVPIVILTIEGTHTNTAFGRITYEVASVTASGFTARVINPTDSTYNVVFGYMAIIP